MNFTFENHFHINKKYKDFTKNFHMPYIQFLFIINLLQ